MSPLFLALSPISENRVAGVLASRSSVTGPKGRAVGKLLVTSCPFRDPQRKPLMIIAETCNHGFGATEFCFPFTIMMLSPLLKVRK
jgi:hypothetical protein